MSSFSVTGSLLSGTTYRPDIITIARPEFYATQKQGELFSTRYKEAIFSVRCDFNKHGYIPVVSTISGLCRFLLGLVHTIVHLACAIFGDIEHALRQAKLGVINIGRGLVEAIPVAGNIAMVIFDNSRINAYEKIAKDELHANIPHNDLRKVDLFICGDYRDSRPIDEYDVDVGGALYEQNVDFIKFLQIFKQIQ